MLTRHYRPTILKAVLLAVLSGLVVFCGCATDPDGQSGGDGRRDQAADLPLEEWLTDENGVFYGGGDRNDWRKLEVKGSGTIYVEVAVDNKDAEVVAVLYDKYGQRLIEKTKQAGTTDHLKFQGPVSKGRYFVRVYAQRSEDRSVYSIRASMEGGAAIGDIAPPE
jgi:hypothetical protein